MGNEKENVMGTFVRLVDYGTTEKESEFSNENNRFVFDIKNDNRIPASPIVYQASEKLLSIFEKGKLLGELAVARNGMKTGTNDKFIRLWWEVSSKKSMFNAKTAEEAIISGKKWFPYNKGGGARKWYGNNDYVVNWENGGQEVIGRAQADGRHVQDYPNDMKFEESVTWSLINTNAPTFRLKRGSISDIAGMSFYKSGENTYYLLGLCNSSISSDILQMIAPTMNYQAGDIARLPVSMDNVSKNEIDILVAECVDIAKEDWDSFEISWDFNRHYLLKANSLIEDVFQIWSGFCEKRSSRLAVLEQKIDDVFFDIYGLDRENYNNNNREESLLYRSDIKKDIKGLISYIVGCIMGRYSLKEDGLIYAGGKWDESRYSDNFKPCEYGVIPITEEQFFEEDLCTRVIEFIKVVYGEDTLKENLQFIASALKPESYGAPKKVIREYLFSDFFNDHYQTYQHRPIYWQMDSGKVGGFRAIVYMHRYDENTLPIVRTEYIQDLRYKYEEEMQRLQRKLADANTTPEKNAAKKDITALDKKIVECTAYDDLLTHVTGSIQNYVFDLDDGVKTNYAKFLSIDGDRTRNILTVIKL
jgi:hypothetical protein